MGLKEKLTPIKFYEDGSVEFNAIVGGFSMTVGSLAGFFGSKLLGYDDYTSIIHFGVFGMVALYAPYIIGIFKNRNIIQRLRITNKSDSHVFGDSFSVPYVKKPRQIFTADQDDGTYSRKRIIDLVD